MAEKHCRLSNCFWRIVVSQNDETFYKQNILIDILIARHKTFNQPTLRYFLNPPDYKFCEFRFWWKGKTFFGFALSKLLY